jgi:predicted HicB family RNase H-like nuclease
MTTRWLHFRLDEQLLEQARQAAENDRRSLSNWVSCVIERALKQGEAESVRQSGDAAVKE